MSVVGCVWNVMAHTQKPDFVRRNWRVHLNLWGRQFSRLLAAEVGASAIVILDTPCFEVVWRVLATHSIRQFPLHFPPVRHRVPSHFNWTLLTDNILQSCWLATADKVRIEGHHHETTVLSLDRKEDRIKEDTQAQLCNWVTSLKTN
jgi:hypothetical protein